MGKKKCFAICLIFYTSNNLYIFKKNFFFMHNDCEENPCLSQSEVAQGTTIRIQKKKKLLQKKFWRVCRKFFNLKAIPAKSHENIFTSKKVKCNYFVKRRYVNDLRARRDSSWSRWLKKVLTELKRKAY